MSNARDSWAIMLPSLAFENDALLCSLLSLSAPHLAKTQPKEAEAEKVHQKFLDSAIWGHSDDTSHASKENADVLCLTSSILRVCTFAAFQEPANTVVTDDPRHRKSVSRGMAVAFRRRDFGSDESSYQTANIEGLQ